MSYSSIVPGTAVVRVQTKRLPAHAPRVNNNYYCLMTCFRTLATKTSISLWRKFILSHIINSLTWSVTGGSQLDSSHRHQTVNDVYQDYLPSH